MIDKLIKKYNHELNTLAIIGGNHESDTLNIQYDTYKEFIKDLEELKQYIIELIPFLPSEEKCRTFDEALYTEYKICDSDLKEIIGGE